MALLERMDAQAGLMAPGLRIRIRADHPEHSDSPEMLDRFAAGVASRKEGRNIVRHLLKRCPSCCRHLGSVVLLEPLEEPDEAYDEAFDRSLGCAFEALASRREG